MRKRRGDQVLIELGKTFTASLRTVDSVGRIGGEEFLVVAPETNMDGAARLGERIRAAVEGSTFYYKSDPIRVTVSIGISYMPSPEIRSAEDMIALADKALYEAKNGGRNRVVSA